MMEHVIHSNRDLFPDLLEELYVRLTISPFLQARESHRPQSSYRRRQRDLAKRIDPVLAHEPGDF